MAQAFAIDMTIPPSTLTADEDTFLSVITDHPAMPISEVYQRLGGLSWRKGNALRETLSAKGYLLEIETRQGGKGRPAKYFVPTVAAYQRVGKDPPPGRGGMVHREIQRRIVEGSRAKGSHAESEYPLPSGGIVMSIWKQPTTP
jgi:hypothetical protein